MISQGCIGAGIRKGHHQIRIHRRFPGQATAVRLACLIHVLTVNGAVRTGKVDKLKNAKCPIGGCRCLNAFNSVFTNNYNFSGINFTDKFSFYQIKGAGFRCQNIIAIELAKTKGSKTMRIFYTDNFTLAGQHDKGKSALQSGYRINDRLFET